MTAQNLHKASRHDEGVPLHRIGTVSRQAGVPVSTLRMWESRYAAFAPGKTGGRHRLYSETDVVRARVLRQLTNAGHSIGRIAPLPLQQLHELLTEARVASGAASRFEGPARLRLGIVGAALATRLQAAPWMGRLEGTVFDVRGTFTSLDDACCADAIASLRDADMLLVRVNALQAPTLAQLLELKSATGVRNAVLLYNFGARGALDALRDAGFLTRREPVDDAELAELLRSVTWASSTPSSFAPEPRAAAIPGRRFAESELARIAASPSHMLCECPRHLADIIVQLASFEDYSAQCLNDSEEDARVHAQLRSAAGSARALFEQALDMVIEHDRRRSRLA